MRTIAEIEKLRDETLERWIQGHFKGCRHAMQNDLPYSAAAYAWKLHKMWQVVEARRNG